MNLPRASMVPSRETDGRDFIKYKLRHRVGGASASDASAAAGSDEMLSAIDAHQPIDVFVAGSLNVFV